MTDIDDIMKKIDILHGETQQDIAKIEDKLIDLDKKVDIHIEIAKVMEKSKLTRNQKIAILGILTPIIITAAGVIYHI